MLAFFFRLFIVVMILLMVNRWFRFSNVYLDRLEKRLDQWAVDLTDRFRLWAPVARNGFYFVVAVMLGNHYAQLDLPVVTSLGEWFWDTFLNHDFESAKEIALTVVKATVVVLFLAGVNRYGRLDIGLLNRVDRWLDELGAFVSFRMGNIPSVARNGVSLLAVAVWLNSWAGFNLPILDQIEAFARSTFADVASPRSVEVSVGRVRSACEKERAALESRIFTLRNRGAMQEAEGNDDEAQETYRKADRLQSELRTCD